MGAVLTTILLLVGIAITIWAGVQFCNATHILGDLVDKFIDFLAKRKKG